MHIGAYPSATVDRTIVTVYDRHQPSWEQDIRLALPNTAVFPLCSGDHQAGRVPGRGEQPAAGKRPLLLQATLASQKAVAPAPFACFGNSGHHRRHCVKQPEIPHVEQVEQATNPAFETPYCFGKRGSLHTNLHGDSEGTVCMSLGCDHSQRIPAAATGTHPDPDPLYAVTSSWAAHASIPPTTPTRAHTHHAEYHASKPITCVAELADP